MKKLDTLLYGLLVALILPILTYLVCYSVKANTFSLGEFTSYLFNSPTDRTRILTFCVLPNMFLFYFVNFRFHMNQFTKGLVVISLLLGLSIAISAI